MAEEDEGRVEAHIGLIGRGLSATPERIEELMREEVAVARRRRPKPEQPFAAVLDRNKKDEPAEASQPADKQARNAALPKNAPRPGLRHPSEEAAFGAVNKPRVVLKG